jgi:hypothetical protein
VWNKTISTKEIHMPPVITFTGANATNLYTNPGLAPASWFRVGNTTNITISLSNAGDGGGVTVELWWIGPSIILGAGPMVDLVNTNRLVPPYGSSYQISFNVPAGGVHAVTVSWNPSAADFPPTLGANVPGCLFAQVVIPAMYPIPPGWPANNSACNNWDPSFPLCAQHNIRIAT